MADATHFGSTGDVAIVLVSRLQKPVVKALDYAIAARHEKTIALHVALTPEDGVELQRQWQHYAIPIPLVIVDSPYRTFAQPVEQFIRQYRETHGPSVVTVYLPQYIVGHRWEKLLHNRRARRMANQLMLVHGVTIALVPWLLDSSELIYGRRSRPAGPPDATSLSAQCRLLIISGRRSRPGSITADGSRTMVHRIGYLIGSLASDSINRVLAGCLVRLAPDTLELSEIPIRDLPLYNRDDELTPTAAVTEFKNAIEAADGLLFISPEYNRSIPGALKNAIDIGSRPWGQNSFARKPTGIIGASVGSIGTAVMQSSMRSVLSFLDAPQLNAPEAYIHFDPAVYQADGQVTDESTAEFLRHYMSEYEAFVDRVLSSVLPGHMGDSDPDVMH